jgi:signal transduction histidine kinase
MPTNLSVYDKLSRLRWPRSYLGKFLLIAFVGVHVTLSAGDWGLALPFLLIALLATLAGALATLLVQGKLLAPLLLTSRAMNDYVHHRARPALPTTYSDEAGLLMRAAQETITHLDELIRLKNQLLAVLSHDTRAPLSTIMMANSCGTWWTQARTTARSSARCSR